MAKKKDGESAKKAPRKPPGGDVRGIVLAIRGKEDWKAWVDRLAEYDRASLNELIDRALARYARDIGFKDIPPER